MYPPINEPINKIGNIDISIFEIRYRVIAPTKLKNKPTTKSVYPTASLNVIPYIFVSIKV